MTASIPLQGMRRPINTFFQGIGSGQQKKYTEYMHKSQAKDSE